MSMMLALLAPALAELPLPVQPDCDGAIPESCPDDLEDRWYLVSQVPEASRDTVRPAELEIGSGIWADRAWRTTTGRWDTLIAVCDSGIEWQSSQLINKVYLNTGELPPPHYLDGEGVERAAEVYDLDGNGLVNVQDYAGDPRVRPDAGADAADDRLDPSDLIHTFSDGVDDDGNGYTDDIAGWDFFADDNDAWNDWDTSFGTHGTGVMEQAAAEGGDGDGHIGVCPNCAVLPCRVGDSFITDGTRAAVGVAYAVDAGADVIGLAIGALSDPMVAREALAYARDQGVVVVGAAGDENAYHRNFPAVHDDVLFVHSVRGNNANEPSGVYSFLNFWNCNNYGPRVELVAPAEACATGAVASTIGVVGLVESAAADAGVTLRPDEVRQLLIGTVDDVWLSEEELAEAGSYPSSEGYDPFYGYGRVNAARAVEAVAAGQIPPVARLSGLRWFELVDPSRGGRAELVVEVSAERADSFQWTLEIGGGWEPEQWVPVDSGEGSGSLELSLTLDPELLPRAAVPEPALEEGVLERVERVHAPAVTARLRVTDDRGLSGEARRTFFVHEDPDGLPGFPVDLGSSGESSPVLADLDGDGVFEIVVGDANGMLWALDGAGQPLPGWPVRTDRGRALAVGGGSPAFHSLSVDPDFRQTITATAAVGDLDGDGAPEVVAASLEGQVYVWSAGGQRLPGFPVSVLGDARALNDGDHTYDDGIVGAPTLADIDGDGDLEIIAAGMDSRLYAWHHDGAAVEHYPVAICHPENCGLRGDRVITSVTAADIDGDGDLDLGLGTNETLDEGRYSLSFVLDARSATLLPGWPRAASGLIAEASLLPTIAWGHPASMAAADIDGDGDMELFDPVMLGQDGLVDHRAEEVLGLSYSQDHYGEAAGTSEPSFTVMTNNPAFGDLDGDGVPDPVVGGAGTYGLVALAATVHVDFQQVVGAWSGATGELLPGWPRQIEDLQFLLAPAIADVGGSAAPEVIFGSAGGVLHAWDAEGAVPDGWPKFTGQWLLGSPAVGDIDGDGWLDVVVTSREGYVHAWRTAGRADQVVQWASLHHDPANTGSYHTPLSEQVGPEEVLEAGGCCAERRGGASGLLGLPLLLLLWRRRAAPAQLSGSSSSSVMRS